MEALSGKVGTPLYSSPEQFASQKYDHRTDIYSLAIIIVLLFSCFNTAHEQRTLLENIRRLKIEEIDMPSRLKVMVKECLGIERERPSL